MFRLHWLHCALLAAELRFQEAMVVLRRCSPEPVQPAAFFPLFPGAAAPWAAAAPAPRLWGLHAPLLELHALIARRCSDATIHQEAVCEGHTDEKCYCKVPADISD